jgi:hypothetical protein
VAYSVLVEDIACTTSGYRPDIKLYSYCGRTPDKGVMDALWEAPAHRDAHLGAEGEKSVAAPLGRLFDARNPHALMPLNKMIAAKNGAPNLTQLKDPAVTQNVFVIEVVARVIGSSPDLNYCYIDRYKNTATSFSVETPSQQTGSTVSSHFSLRPCLVTFIPIFGWAFSESSLRIKPRPFL